MKQTLKNIVTWFFAAIVIWLSFIPAVITGRYSNAAYLILGFFLAVSFFCSKKSGYFIDSEFDKFIWLFLIWNFFSALFAYDKSAAFKRYLDFVIPFITIYFMAKNELDDKRIKLLIRILFFSGIVVSIIGILEFIYGRNMLYEGVVQNPFYKQYVSLPRIMSTMMHPTVLGTYLMICLPASFFIIERAIGRLKKIAAMTGLAMILAALILTFSRTGWAVSAAIAFIYFYIKNKKKMLLLTAIMVLFLSSIFIAVKLKPTVQYRVDYKHIVNYLIEGHRLERYPLTIKMIKDHPFAGVGLNNYRILFDGYYGQNKVPYNIKIPDNMYLSIMGETGLVGMLLFVALLFCVIKKGFALLRDRENKDWGIILVLFSSIIGILMHMVSYDLFYWIVPYYLFLLFLGGLASYSNNK
ncbi:MAG: O-antigen ligase family protein [Patescibacteria group bacterium]